MHTARETGRLPLWQVHRVCGTRVGVQAIGLNSKSVHVGAMLVPLSCHRFPAAATGCRWPLADRPEKLKLTQPLNFCFLWDAAKNAG